jgi:hypothetical protein
MNVEIGTEATKFLFCEYLFQILGIVSLQCRGEGLYSKKNMVYGTLCWS